MALGKLSVPLLEGYKTGLIMLPKIFEDEMNRMHLNCLEQCVGRVDAN